MEEEGVWILITEGLSEAEAILGMIVESDGSGLVLVSKC